MISLSWPPTVSDVEDCKRSVCKDTVEWQEPTAMSTSDLSIHQKRLRNLCQDVEGSALEPKESAPTGQNAGPENKIICAEIQEVMP